MLYSIKMRALKKQNGINKHISGAEKFVTEEMIDSTTNSLIARAKSHSKGKPDTIHIKIERIAKKDMVKLKALDVTTFKADSVKKGHHKVCQILSELGIKNPQNILSIMKEAKNMRGAILLDANTLVRLDPDKCRGIRATYMDYEDFQVNTGLKSLKANSHFLEALCLATKVIGHKDILAELCISDDPDYTTGYVASKWHGYVRITAMKELGDENGGRIFLYNGSLNDIDGCIDYLQSTKVLVTNFDIDKCKLE